MYSMYFSQPNQWEMNIEFPRMTDAPLSYAYACKSILINYHDYAENETVTAENLAPSQYRYNESEILVSVDYTETIQRAEHRG